VAIEMPKKVNQETDIVVAMATRIYEVGATYRSVEPDMYEVTPDNGETTLMSVYQFHTTLSCSFHEVFYVSCCLLVGVVWFLPILRRGLVDASR
jgi:hypothetical protein